MLTRFLAYLCFIMASCWLLFAGGLLVAAIRQEPQHLWLSTGLMLTVLLPTGCTALYRLLLRSVAVAPRLRSLTRCD